MVLNFNFTCDESLEWKMESSLNKLKMYCKEFKTCAGAGNVICGCYPPFYFLSADNFAQLTEVEIHLKIFIKNLWQDIKNEINISKVFYSKM